MILPMKLTPSSHETLGRKCRVFLRNLSLSSQAGVSKVLVTVDSEEYCGVYLTSFECFRSPFGY